MFHFIGHIIFGLIVGVLAKFVVPGPHPGGIIVTILLGIAGAALGGYLGRALGWYPPGHPAGFGMAFVGAVILLLIYHFAFETRAEKTASNRVHEDNLAPRVTFVSSGNAVPART